MRAGGSLGVGASACWRRGRRRREALPPRGSRLVSVLLVWAAVAISAPTWATPWLPLRSTPGAWNTCVVRRLAEAGGNSGGGVAGIQAAEEPDTSAESQELGDLLQQPGLAAHMKEALDRLVQDPARKAVLSNTVSKLRGKAGEGVGENTTLATLTRDPMKLLSIMTGIGDEKVQQEFIRQYKASAEDLRPIEVLGRDALGLARVLNLNIGSLVQLKGLSANPELNGLRGVLVEPLEDEGDALPDRRIVELQDGQRVAVPVERLEVARYLPGDTVTLAAEFEGADEGLEYASAVVSELTEEERELGFRDTSVRVVVDVLPGLPGAPVLTRLFMMPEQLRPRGYTEGDSVELKGLVADTTLNGQTATVVPALPEEASADGGRQVVVMLDADGRRLAVREANLRLLCNAPPKLRRLR